jgi:hypothetical protein
MYAFWVCHAQPVETFQAQVGNSGAWEMAKKPGAGVPKHGRNRRVFMWFVRALTWKVHREVAESDRFPLSSFA